MDKDRDVLIICIGILAVTVFMWLSSTSNLGIALCGVLSGALVLFEIITAAIRLIRNK